MYRYAGLRTDASHDSRLEARAAPPLEFSSAARKRESSKYGRARRHNPGTTEETGVTGASGDRDGHTAVAVGGLWRVAALRAAFFLCLWLVLAGADPTDIPAAVAAIVAATWTSLRLLEPSRSRRSVPALAQLALLFLYQSVVAGVDVARRALDPKLPLRPGFLVYPTGLSRGMRRNVFTTLTSLLPGTGANRRGERADRLSLPRHRAARRCRTCRRGSGVGSSALQ